MFARLISAKRPAALHQGEFAFLSRRRRLERIFKAVILGLTALILSGMVFGTTGGRRLVEASRSATVDGVSWLLGFLVDRDELEARKRRGRQLGIELTRKNLIAVEREASADLREFLKVARLDSDSALLRWGNFDWTLSLSSAVFEADDTGRSYRLRPSTRSVWLINLILHDVLAMFEIPDTPEARRLGQAAGGRLVPGSVQTTNSWGCRGPEPDPTAPVRGIVLGDSNMQGLLVGDEQTPPARLEARLRDELKVPVSILNTGHLGYSPEQYYYSLVAYFDRLKPQFVLVTLCANDFGDMNDDKNWAETAYWMEAITLFCRARGVEYLIMPLPTEMTVAGIRNENPYPARLTAILRASGLNYLDLTEEFATESLAIRVDSVREGRPVEPSPLFNVKYNDYHLSPIGCDLWAKIVARRLGLLWGLRNPGGVGPIAPTNPSIDRDPPRSPP